MNNKLSYWLWLYKVLAPCSARFKDLFYSYDYVEDIFENRKSTAMQKVLSPAEFSRACKIELADTEQIIERCQKYKIEILCHSDDKYPDQLRKTRIPPMVLFATGDINKLGGLCVAGVGSRNETQYGRDAVKKICEPLAKSGITLVSGLAYGTDINVHKCAINNASPTIAVLGNPINETYPSDHSLIREQIEHNGCVISEYEPCVKVQKYSFPQRNRIISGLSKSVIIFEAAKRSGTMITANWALDDGREVFAVPGNITSRQSEGTNYLIKQGASPATTAEDILSSLGLEPFVQYEQTSLEPTKKQKMTANQQIVARLLEAGEQSLDSLMESADLMPHELLSELTMMELDGIIESLSGSRYKLK